MSVEELNDRFISIHTFLAEGDSQWLRSPLGSMIISIHTFLAEGDDSVVSGWVRYVTFQSTPSLRKATHQQYVVFAEKSISIHTFLAEGDKLQITRKDALNHFNPHLPCGRRPVNDVLSGTSQHFNPHLPCGRRHSTRSSRSPVTVFQSTPSLRKATQGN